MGKDQYQITGTVSREIMVDQVRKAARQFAMQFFHFSKVLYERYGLETAKDIMVGMKTQMEGLEILTE